MKLKGKRVMAKEEAGELLIHLGERLKSGKLRYPEDFGEGVDLGVNEPLEVEVEYKEKHGRNKFEVEIKWSPTKGYAVEPRSDNVGTRKAVKKEMKTTLYKVEKAIASGKLTAARPAFKRFQELNERFNDLAEGEWERDMNAQSKLVVALGKALSEGDSRKAMGMVDKIWKFKKVCHGKYKGR